MINHSRPQYIFIHACIFALQVITPAAVTWIAFRAAQSFAKPQWLHSRALLPLDIWFGAETIFYFAVQLPVLLRIQRPAEHPALLSKHERQTLFERFTEDLTPKEAERHLRGWFRGAEIGEIGRGEIKSWLGWAFFEGRVDLDDEELEVYTLSLEQLLGRRFATGTGIAKPIRLTLDPIIVGHRSLTWYCIIGIVDSLVHLKMCWYGFQHYRRRLRTFFSILPFRPLTVSARHCSPATHLSYWLRPHTSKTRLPILFIHGIGIGLYPYVDFLNDINNEKINLLDCPSSEDDGEVGILALEIMPISFRLTHSALTKSTFVSEITTILESHNEFSSFVLVAHSYGTILATHMLSCPALRHQIESLVLVDPVCFLLHQPSVAYNFTIRPPKRANEWQLWYFASKDWGVAHTLGRRFFWRENVLWKEDVEGVRCTVSLSGRDLIVNTEDVGKYLIAELTDENEAEEDWKSKEWKGDGLEVFWNEDKDHAQVFDPGWMRDRLVGAVREYTRDRK